MKFKTFKTNLIYSNSITLEQMSNEVEVLAVKTGGGFLAKGNYYHWFETCRRLTSLFNLDREETEAGFTINFTFKRFKPSGKCPLLNKYNDGKTINMCHNDGEDYIVVGIGDSNNPNSLTPPTEEADLKIIEALVEKYQAISDESYTIWWDKDIVNPNTCYTYRCALKDLEGAVPYNKKIVINYFDKQIEIVRKKNTSDDDHVFRVRNFNPNINQQQRWSTASYGDINVKLLLSHLFPNSVNNILAPVLKHINGWLQRNPKVTLEAPLPLKNTTVKNTIARYEDGTLYMNDTPIPYSLNTDDNCLEFYFLVFELLTV